MLKLDEMYVDTHDLESPNSRGAQLLKPLELVSNHLRSNGSPIKDIDESEAFRYVLSRNSNLEKRF